jgi:hypothetical protein
MYVYMRRHLFNGGRVTLQAFVSLENVQLPSTAIGAPLPRARHLSLDSAVSPPPEAGASPGPAAPHVPGSFSTISLLSSPLKDDIFSYRWQGLKCALFAPPHFRHCGSARDRRAAGTFKFLCFVAPMSREKSAARDSCDVVGSFGSGYYRGSAFRSPRAHLPTRAHAHARTHTRARTHARPPRASAAILVFSHSRISL